MTEDSRRIDYLPSPQEIAQACARIREHWTLNERRRRFIGDWIPEEFEAVWYPPTVSTSALRVNSNRGVANLAV